MICELPESADAVQQTDVCVRVGVVQDWAQPAQLPVEERQQSLRYRMPWRRQEFIAGRLLVRKAIYDCQRINGEISIVREQEEQATSRPQAFVNGQPSGLSISITHSDGFVAASASACPAGIDLVSIGSVTRSLQATWMSVEERDAISRSASPDQVAARIWGAKEAAFKVLPDQDGFRPCQWHIRIEENQAICEYRNIPQPLTFEFFSLSSTLMLAVASSGTEPRNIHLAPSSDSRDVFDPKR